MNKKEEENQQMHERSRKRKKRFILILILLLLLSLALAYCRKSKGLEQQQEQGELFIGNIKKGMIPGADTMKAAEEGRVRMQINSEVVFADEKSEGNLYIGNPDTNLYDMEVTITLNDTGTVVYQSGKIPPGYYIDKDKLQTALAAGAYAAKASIVYYDGEEVQVNYGVNLNITILN